MKRNVLIILFWVALVAFFAWDWAYSKPVDLRQEPPIIAVGSGQAPSGAHCASTF